MRVSGGNIQFAFMIGEIEVQVSEFAHAKYQRDILVQKNAGAVRQDQLGMAYAYAPMESDLKS
jgi:hypothetical protein